MIEWHTIEPAEAVGLDLTKRLDITAPLNEAQERCPWPWEPQQLVGAPLGQYHCPYCGAMVVAGVRHPDYAGWDMELKRFYDEVEEDPPCDCATQNCSVRPCKGVCGCAACRLSYMDFLSSE